MWPLVGCVQMTLICDDEKERVQFFFGEGVFAALLEAFKLLPIVCSFVVLYHAFFIEVAALLLGILLYGYLLRIAFYDAAQSLVVERVLLGRAPKEVDFIETAASREGGVSNLRLFEMVAAAWCVGDIPFVEFIPAHVNSFLRSHTSQERCSTG